ncbi:hypothetical protein CYMTET_45339, partial [Cymbomonas tetramitiformis]
VKVVDTVGAGDGFVGTFVSGLASGWPIDKCLRHAVVAGSLTCKSPGAQPAMKANLGEIAKHVNEIEIEVDACGKEDVDLTALNAQSRKRKHAS